MLTRASVYISSDGNSVYPVLDVEDANYDGFVVKDNKGNLVTIPVEVALIGISNVAHSREMAVADYLKKFEHLYKASSVEGVKPEVEVKEAEIVKEEIVKEEKEKDESSLKE